MIPISAAVSTGRVPQFAEAPASSLSLTGICFACFFLCQVLESFGFLYEAYNVDSWAFELADMSYKLFLTSILVCRILNVPSAITLR